MAVEYPVRVTYDRAMIGEAARRYARRAIGLGMPVAFLLLLVALVDLLLRGDRSWVVGALGAIFVLGLAVVSMVLRGATYLTLPIADLPDDVRTCIAQQVQKHGGRVG